MSNIKIYLEIYVIVIFALLIRSDLKVAVKAGVVKEYIGTKVIKRYFDSSEISFCCRH